MPFRTHRCTPTKPPTPSTLPLPSKVRQGPARILAHPVRPRPVPPHHVGYVLPRPLRSIRPHWTSHPPRPRSPNQYPVPKKQCRRGVTRLNPSPSLIRRKAIIAASRRLPSRRSHRLHPPKRGVVPGAVPGAVPGGLPRAAARQPAAATRPPGSTAGGRAPPGAPPRSRAHASQRPVPGAVPQRRVPGAVRGGVPGAVAVGAAPAAATRTAAKGAKHTPGPVPGALAVGSGAAVAAGVAGLSMAVAADAAGEKGSETGS